MIMNDKYQWSCVPCVVNLPIAAIADGPTPISREEIPKIIPSTHRYGKPMVSQKNMVRCNIGRLSISMLIYWAARYRG